MKKLMLFAVVILLTVGCGGLQRPLPQDNPPPRSTPSPIPSPTPIANPVTFTLDQVFNPAVGDVWKFTTVCNSAVQTTTIAIESAPVDAAGTTGQHVILHFTKTDPCTYWGLNIVGAEDHFLMMKTSEGYTGRADIPTFPVSCPWCDHHTSMTLNWHPVAGFPTPYMIFPATITQGQTIGSLTKYDWWLLYDINTTDDIATPSNYQGQRPWKTVNTVEQVDTPAYKGLAVISHQYEGDCSTPAVSFPTEPTKWCNEEKWAAAPADATQNFTGGLVQIIAFVDGKPVLTINRTN